MKKLVFVYSKNDIGRAVSYSEKNDCTIISLTPETDFFLSRMYPAGRSGRVRPKEEMRFRTLSSYRIKKQPYRDLYLRRRQLFSGWGRIDISGVALEEQISVDGVSLWELLESEIGELDLEVIMHYAGVISKILREEKPGTVLFLQEQRLYYVQRDRIFFPSLIRAVCEKYKVHCEPIPKLFSGQVSFRRPVQEALEYAIDISARYRERERFRFKRYRFTEGRKRVLFFLYGYGMDKTAPVQKLLAEKGVDAVSICSGGVSSNSCLDFFSQEENKKFMYAYLDSFSDRNIDSRARGEGKRLSSLWPAVLSQKKKFSYDGVALFDVMEAMLHHIFTFRLHSLAKLVLLMGKVLSEAKPGIVVTVNDFVSFGKCVVLCARKKGIRSILIQHAKSPDISSLAFPVSDYICTWGRVDRKDLGRGVDPKRFIMTGSSKKNFISEQVRRGHKDKILSELKLSLNHPGRGQGTKIALFAARFPITRDYFRIETLARLAGTDGFMLIIKQHPADMTTNINELRKIFPYKNVMFLRQFNFVKLLSVADVIVSTEECTTCLDTIMVEKPLVTIAYEDSFDRPFTDIYRYGKNPPFIRVCSEAELKAAVGEVLSDRNYADQILRRMRKYNHKHFESKNSESHIADFIIPRLSKVK